MALVPRREWIADVKDAFANCNLSLFLGAGVSIASGVPSWNALVNDLYADAIAAADGFVGIIGTEQQFHDTLLWHAWSRRLPPDIMAEEVKVRTNPLPLIIRINKRIYRDYAPTAPNATLSAVSDLCKATQGGKRAVQAVITYNYDDLLEQQLGTTNCTPVWSPPSVLSRLFPKSLRPKLPIYHVHGYLPLTTMPSNPSVVFTEEEYHRLANYRHWRNEVQLSSMRSCVGLTLGCSLTDRNVRRLLAKANVPVGRISVYALLPHPKQTPNPCEVQLLEDIAKDPPRSLDTIALAPSLQPTANLLLTSAEAHSTIHEAEVFEELGVRPYYYRTHNEVAQIIREIMK